VRVQLDARHDGDRRRWVAALAPLATVQPPSALPRSAWRAPAAKLVALGMAGLLAGLGYVAYLAHLGRDDDRAAPSAAFRPAERPPAPPAGVAAPGVSPAGLPRFAVGPPVAPLATPVTPGDPESLMRRLLSAAAANDYDAFLEFGGDQFKAVISPDLLREISQHVAPLADGMFTAQPLGTIRKQDGLVHLWKVEMPGRPDDDLLIKLVMEDGKAAGFLIQ
jgi:hypothetical protein